MRPLIGITARFKENLNSHCAHRGYVDQVVGAGGVPVLIPFGDETLCEPTLARLDGLLLTGGEDIDPTFAATTRQDGYGYQPVRDAFEISLAQLAMKFALPILGICRGCQVLSVATGNPLISDVADATDGQVRHRLSISEPARHPVTLVDSGRVADAYRTERLTVTSYHHQALALDDLNDPSWLVTAHSPDRLVEAIEYTGDVWTVGVLWHPELPADDEQNQPDPLIRAFVAAAS